MDNETFLVSTLITKPLICKVKTDGTILQKIESKSNSGNRQLISGFFINKSKEKIYAESDSFKVKIFNTEKTEEA